MKKRLLRKALATGVLTAGLIAVGSPVLAEPAHAMAVKTGGTSGQTLCYWDGKAYSAGAKKEYGGDIYTCQADGSWKKDGRNHPALTSTYGMFAA